MYRFIGVPWLIVILALMGCGKQSGTTDEVNCNALSASQCLDQAVYDRCADKVQDIETQCSDVLEANALASKKEHTLVPELSGSDDTLRDRYDVNYADQSFLFIPQETTPSKYLMRTIQYGLLNVNDLLANDNVHGDGFTAIEPDPALVLPGPSKSKALTDISQITPAMAANPQFMFDGLHYSADMLNTYLDSLYTGKVGEWNDNGLLVESCEEYTYENFYDFSLFKDFMALHHDDPLRVVEYAYRDVTVNENGTPSVAEYEISPGAIGSRGLHFFNKLMFANSPTAMFDGLKDMYQALKRKGGHDETIEPTSVFQDHQLNYASYSMFSDFSTQSSGYISSGDYFDNELTPDFPELMVDGAWAGYLTVSKDPMPKNFFLEIMGKIIPGNADRKNGVVLADQVLKDVYARDEFSKAQECYTNNFYFHFYMLKAAKRLYPDSSTVKTRLQEFKMLRRHLIELLAERSRYESVVPLLLGKPSATMLRNAVTLPRSEKEFAIRKLTEHESGHAAYTEPQATRALSDIEIIDGPVLVDILADIDDQIEAVLRDAMDKGCLDTNLSDTEGNYVATVNVEGNPSSASDGTMMLFEPNLNYDKVFCDWTPELFTVAADQLVPDHVTEKVYDECKRITGNDFTATGVDSFEFKFPSACQAVQKFDAWKPNSTQDYAGSTVRFHEFESLIKAYPSALLDCDAVIQKQTVDDLKESDMNYFDPVSGTIMMSKSMSSYYDGIGGEYAGLDFGYSLGWLYEGYDNVDGISDTGGFNRNLVCSNTNFFAFGNYFVGGSFLKRDFTLCSAGSYASNKTASGGRPVPPTLADSELNTQINNDIQTVASEHNVSTNYFMFIKNEKMTFSYDNNGNSSQTPDTEVHNEPFSNERVNYQTDPGSAAQMISVKMKQSVPICGIMSITIHGAVTGDIDAGTIVSGDIADNFSGDNACKTLNYNFTPYLDFDGFASAAVTAGLSGVASVSAGVDLGLKFAHISFPYIVELSVSQYNGQAVDIDFNYDLWAKAHNSLFQETTLLSGYFGAFVKLEYLVGSDTYHQKLFSWDGIKFSGEIDSLATSEVPFSAPIRALNGLAGLRD